MARDFPKSTDDWLNDDGREKNGFFSSIPSHIVDFIQTIVVFGAIFALIYLFVAQPHKVSGNSMVPNFLNGDYILTEKVSYKLNPPKKGDIIVFKNPRDETQDFIKRIMATPEDIIKVENGEVFVNDIKLNEPYLPKSTSSRSGNFLTEAINFTAGEDQYFVFGDNREHSSDSREWGPITPNKIIGKAFFKYWPIGKLGFIKQGF